MMMEDVKIYLSKEQIEYIKDARGFIEVHQYSQFEPPQKKEAGKFISPLANIRVFLA